MALGGSGVTGFRRFRGWAASEVLGALGVRGLGARV